MESSESLLRNNHTYISSRFFIWLTETFFNFFHVFFFSCSSTNTKINYIRKKISLMMFGKKCIYRIYDTPFLNSTAYVLSTQACLDKTLFFTNMHSDI